MIVLVPVVVALALRAFAWPAARIAPRDLPLGIAGPATAAAPLQERFEQHEGAFDVHRYDDAASARAAIENRDVYGAIVVTPQGPQLLTASAASPVVAGLLREAVTAGAPAGTQVEAAGAPALVLALWTLLGLTAVALTGRRGRRTAEADPAAAQNPALVG